MNGRQGGPGFFARRRLSQIAARHTLATSLNTPTDVLALLASDTEADVREAVAGHPSTPTRVLDRLAADVDRGVRCAVALNPNTSDGTRVRLSTDHEVRAQIAMVETGPIKALNPPPLSATA